MSVPFVVLTLQLGNENPCARDVLELECKSCCRVWKNPPIYRFWSDGTKWTRGDMVLLCTMSYLIKHICASVISRLIYALFSAIQSLSGEIIVEVCEQSQPTRLFDSLKQNLNTYRLSLSFFVHVRTLF